ncbi:MAG TPA: exodeoxyribonuclease V subunit alpha [Verrucomicrobiae bacterium]|nr:exodeoxyribonuclease V subunit alpha [Verrucomicrobiae bacterium]
MNAETLNQTLRNAAFGPIDRHFAKFVERLAGGENPELALAAAIVSQHRQQGNICVHLPQIASTELPSSIENETSRARLPKLNNWLKQLRAASSVVGAPGDFKPLILDDHHRLYLHRYWQYENNLTQAVRERVRSSNQNMDWDLFRDGLKRLFPQTPGGEVDWQKVAAFAAARNNFCIISGGPGTGKTHTVALILALLIEQAGKTKLRINLAAPTGKAAARLQESLKLAKAGMNCPEPVKAQIPDNASTLHRLLGYLPGSASFRHDANNPLPADVVVVDEASMVDLALMAKLFEAVPSSARLILLGDKDQLASVEAGAVLGDLCNAGFNRTLSSEFASDCEKLTGESIPAATAQNAQRLADCIVELQKNYRFSRSSRIYQLSRAVNHGDAAQAAIVLGTSGSENQGISWRHLPQASDLKAQLKPLVLEHFAPAFRCRDPETALRQIEKFRILCALRQGHYGVETLNRWVEEILRETGLIKTDADWYAGRPVIITRNDYVLKLFNGDIGVVLPNESGSLWVFFRGAEGKLVPFLPLRLPEHETVYAMTVHKSQGSEFENVLFILPERDRPILTRELIYTGLTRARQNVHLWLREETLKNAIARRVQRTSGLRETLWES